MSTAMLIPISEGIGQAKWQWLRQPNPLIDVEVYDKASRGPWGAMKLLWRIRGRHIASLGGLVTILALSIDPFVQQVTTYQPEQVPLYDNATLPVRNWFNNTWAAIHQGAFYSAIYNSGDAQLSYYCPSANCSWPEYQTLAICSQCVNISSLVRYSSNDEQVQRCNFSSSECMWSLPNGLSLANEAYDDYSGSQPSALPSFYTLNASGLLPAITLDHVGYAVVNFSFIGDTETDIPTATECSLYWCLNTYTAAVNNSVFSESLQSSWINTTASPPMVTVNESYEDQEPFYNMTPPVGIIDMHRKTEDWLGNILNSSSDQPQKSYLVQDNAYFGQWMQGQLTGAMENAAVSPGAGSSYGTSNDILVLLSNDLQDNFPQLVDIFNRLAQALTIAIRSSDPNAQSAMQGNVQTLGTGWTEVTIVRVRWAWLSLPAALLFLSMTFLGITMWETNTDKMWIWNSSTLPLLFYSLVPTRNELENPPSHLVEMEAEARRTLVRLNKDMVKGNVRRRLHSDL